MKKWSCLLMIVGVLMVALALPTAAADTSSAQPVGEETAAETTEELEELEEETVEETLEIPALEEVIPNPQTKYSYSDALVTVTAEIEIEDEETPLAGLPGVYRDDVARIIIGAGGCMIVAAGAILVTGLRREHARR